MKKTKRILSVKRLTRKQRGGSSSKSPTPPRLSYFGEFIQNEKDAKQFIKSFYHGELKGVEQKEKKQLYKMADLIVGLDRDNVYKILSEWRKYPPRDNVREHKFVEEVLYKLKPELKKTYSLLSTGDERLPKNIKEHIVSMILGKTPTKK